MKIVFAASEAAPFIKTGGLGDVAQALPMALSKFTGNEVSVFLPYYSAIKNNSQIETEFICDFKVNLSWRTQYVGVFKLKSKKRKLKVYFIDNEYYFARDNAYGYFDDGERFAFFSKAILESMLRLNMSADIIHCNDWQTALIPIYLHAFYHDTLGSAKTVFTIHNIEYQGKADEYFLHDTLGLPERYVNTLSFDGCVNFMKGAILSSDAVTTVSARYAEELRNPYYSFGLSEILNSHGFKLSGIVNGIDQNVCNPLTDDGIAVKYALDDFKTGKASNKEALQKELGLEVRPDVAVIGMVSRLVSHKGIGLILDIIDELMKWDIQLVILGTGDKFFEDELYARAKQNSGKFSLNLCFNSALASQIYAGSDIYLMPSKSEPCGLSQMIAMRYGTVPVVHETGGLKDTVLPFNDETGMGEGFTFQAFNAENLKDALRRALSVFGGDKEKWCKIILNDMKKDTSWDKPATEYMKLYSELI